MVCKMVIRNSLKFWFDSFIGGENMVSVYVQFWILKIVSYVVRASTLLPLSGPLSQRAIAVLVCVFAYCSICRVDCKFAR
jgi:hypothetical protein